MYNLYEKKLCDQAKAGRKRENKSEGQNYSRMGSHLYVGWRPACSGNATHWSRHCTLNDLLTILIKMASMVQVLSEKAAMGM